MFSDCTSLFQAKPWLAASNVLELQLSLALDSFATKQQFSPAVSKSGDLLKPLYEIPKYGSHEDPSSRTSETLPLQQGTSLKSKSSDHAAEGEDADQDCCHGLQLLGGQDHHLHGGEVVARLPR